MYIFKFIIASVMALGASEDGWVFVPKPVKPQEQSEERDSSIWALLVKNLGEEQFMVRFPDEPQYRTGEDGNLHISCEKLGEYFSLTVRKLGSEDSKTGGLSQFLEGKWVHEQVLQSERYQYHFRTISDLEDSPNHKDFVNSFGFFS